jgi:L-lysine 2,3-aminomutase
LWLIEPFATTPVFIARIQTTNGLDTASVRCQSLGPTQVEVQTQEEQSLDSETDHAAEVVGYMVFGAP